jgi:tRNA-specific 2-thiouridylase
VAGSYRVIDGQMEIVVTEPIIGVAPGQTAVLYLGTRVLGQTTIEKTLSAISVGVE